ncbi:hypothetical protein [Saccharopolyspora gregorii]|uniref:hypothetical protein n=1 Tax=Saccharopolyspora gregorii TaxID=33914 RepID=UPI0021AC69EC|nr:hypothetical protein [Saccharopolyspora gregorii]
MISVDTETIVLRKIRRPGGPPGRRSRAQAPLPPSTGTLAPVTIEARADPDRGAGHRDSAALRLTDGESDHLHVGPAPNRTRRHRRDARPGIRTLLERLPLTAGIVVSARFDVLAWHPVVGEVTVDCDSLALSDRNQHLVFHTAQPGSPPRRRSAGAAGRAGHRAVRRGRSLATG